MQLPIKPIQFLNHPVAAFAVEVDQAARVPVLVLDVLALVLAVVDNQATSWNQQEI